MRVYISASWETFLVTVIYLICVQPLLGRTLCLPPLPYASKPWTLIHRIFRFYEKDQTAACHIFDTVI